MKDNELHSIEYYIINLCNMRVDEEEESQKEEGEENIKTNQIAGES